MVPNDTQCVLSMSGPEPRGNSAAFSLKESSSAGNTASDTGNTANLAWLS